MSSPRLRTILRSAVFQLTLVSSAVFILIMLMILWGVSGYQLRQLEASERAQITEVVGYLEDQYYDNGIDSVRDAIAFDGRAIWDSDDVFPILEQGDFVIVFRDPNYEAIAGYPGLWSGDDWSTETLEHDVIDDALLSFGTQLRGGYSLRVARFLPQEREEFEGFRAFGTLALIMVGLPLSLAIGYFLSRRVFRRIANISDTAQSVASGAVDTRAPISDSNDEFDRLASGINQMLDRLETLNRNISSVSVGVAHDLKTPLANIRGRLELIERDANDPAAIKTHVEAADTHLNGLLRIFDAILRLGEVEAGQRKSAFGLVDLSGLVASLGEAYEAAFEDRDKTLTCDVAKDIRLSGDQELLAQMITNLLDNAIEHARDGAKVRLSLRSDGQSAVIEVADNGPGIAPTHQDRIFERFYRGEASRTTPGNGLGLSLVKAIADLHGATVELRPNDEGSTFVVTLPRLP